MPAGAVFRPQSRRVMPVPAGGTGGKLVHGGHFPKTPVEDKKPRPGPHGETGRDWRAWLQKQAQRILWLFGDRGKRLSFGGCGMGLHFSADALEIHRHEGTDDRPDSYSFVGLAHCGNPWVCPICAPRIGAVRVDEIAKAVQKLLEKGFSYLFATYTARHTAGMSLIEFAVLFRRAQNEFKKSRYFKKLQKLYKRAFEITATEVTDDDPRVPDEARTGWHFHVHSLILLDRRFLTETECAEFQAIAAEGWQTACEKVGLECSLERGFYLESFQEHAKKTGKKINFDAQSKEKQDEYVRQVSEYFAKSLGFELTGATRKIAKKGKYGGGRCTPWDLLVAAIKGSVRARERWIEYAYAMRGAKDGGAGFSLIRFSPGLKKAAGIEKEKAKKDKDESVDEDAMRGKKGDAVLSLAVDSWMPVAKQGRLWHLLDIMAADGESAVKAACKKAEKGIDSLTGENLGPGRVNPAWHGCENCPPVQLGGDLAVHDLREKEAENEVRRQQAEEKLIAWQEGIYKRLFIGDYSSIYDDLDSLMFARDHMRSYGRDADLALPLAVPWTGCGLDARLLLPGASVKSVREWSDKKRRYVHTPRIVWQ